MNWIAIIEKLFASSHVSHEKGDSVIAESLDLLRLLRSAGGALSAQAALHGQLMRVEWQEEKSRLMQLLIMTAIAFVCGLCIFIFLGLLVLAASWDTTYRLHSLAIVIITYALGAGFCWYQIRKIAARSSQTFIATREELAADIALIRSKL